MHEHTNAEGHGHHGHHGHCGHGGPGHKMRGFRPPFGAPHGHGRMPGGFGGPRARRGDVRDAVLRLLGEEPMHGYQIIQELSNRSGGSWRPSAGSVYPTLQLLADEGLVTSEETAGKKVFSLTEAGVAAAAELAEQPAPWDEAAQSDSDTGAMGLREAAGRLMPAIMQIGKSANKEQLATAIEILTDARKKLYAILAED